MEDQNGSINTCKRLFWNLHWQGKEAKESARWLGTVESKKKGCRSDRGTWGTYTVHFFFADVIFSSCPLSQSNSTGSCLFHSLESFYCLYSSLVCVSRLKTACLVQNGHKRFEEVWHIFLMHHLIHLRLPSCCYKFISLNMSSEGNPGPEIHGKDNNWRLLVKSWIQKMFTSCMLALL